MNVKSGYTNMAVIIEDLNVPSSCFKCPLSHWYDSGWKAGFSCGALHDAKIISNCEGREKRRVDCPIKEVGYGTK